METKRNLIQIWLLRAAVLQAVMLIASSAQAQNLFVEGVGPGPWNSSGNITEITPGGAKSTFASGLTPPFGLAFDNAGDLFVSEYNSQYGIGSIVEYTSGTPRWFAGTVSRPAGLACDSAGDLFEAEANGNIYEFTPGGYRTTFVTGLNGPQALTFDRWGDLFVADNSNIYEFGPGATRTFATGLYYPSALACNSAGDLFVMAGGNSCVIYKFTTDGVQSTFASGFAYSYGLAFNSAGDLFATDNASGNIYKFTPDGVQSTFASGLPYTYEMAFQPVPETSALELLAFGMCGITLLRRQQR